MICVIQQSLLELKYPCMTNEDPAIAFIFKLGLIENLRTQKHPAFEWGTSDELKEFSALLEV